ncbi:MAG: AAA family ATPase [Pseudomonadota bacterium]
MITLATFNIKGGVGKTAAAVNLAYLSAWEGNRTLVWDLDPQGASTYYFRIKPKVKGGGRALIAGKPEIEHLIKGTDFDNLDLLPSDFSFRNLDLVLEGRKKPTRRLRKLLSPLADDYDFIILDCPPSISLLSECVFEAADALISPVIPTPLSSRTFEQLEEFVRTNKLDALALMPFLSMVDRRKSLHRHMCEILSTEHPAFLKTAIPYASDVERMGVARNPLGYFAPNSASEKAYRALWREIRERLAGR